MQESIRQEQASLEKVTLLRVHVASLVHILAGLVALVSALYFLLSEKLSFGAEPGFIGQRPRIVVCAFFVLAAWLLITGVRRGDYLARRIVGYASMVLGFFTVWLIFEGM